MYLQQVTKGTDRVFDLYNEGAIAGISQPSLVESAEKMNLNELLLTNEIANFFCRVSGL